MTLSNRDVLSAPTPRLDALTGLRWWAAFLVFFYHMLIFAPVPGVLAQLFSYGYFGVTFFFVLSGFVLTWSARPGVSISTFYWRRFARIWPSHIVALVLAIPVFYTFAVIPEGSFLKPFDPGILALSVVLLQAWWSAPIILFSGNPAAWTLTCEAFFYALHPWISRVLVPMAKRGALLVAGAVVVYAFTYRLGVVLAPESWLTAVPVPVQRVPEFILGMALAWAMRSGWRPRIHPFVGVGAMALAILAIVISVRLASAVPLIGEVAAFGNELFTVGCAVAIVSLASASLNGKRVFFDTRIQVKLGEWSFAFYLVHATVIYTALRIFGFQDTSWRNLIWYGVMFVACLVAAWALHSFVERPFERRMRRWKDARDVRTRSLRSVTA